MVTNTKNQAIASAYSIPELSRDVSAPVIREPGSAITHFIAMIFSILGAFPLMQKVLGHAEPRYIISTFIFISCMILLYGASTCFHTFDVNPHINTILKKIHIT